MESQQLLIDIKAPLLLNFFSDLEDDIKPLDIKGLEALEELIEEDSRIEDAFSKASNFRGVIFVKIYPEGDIKITHKNKIITAYDKKILSDWIISREHKKYTDDFYRIDFENYIFIFKVYKFNKNIILAGHMLDNNPSAKIELLTIRQEILKINIRAHANG
jgi:hypothetical protein